MANYFDKNLIERQKAAKRDAVGTMIFVVVLLVLLAVGIYLKTCVFMVVSVKGSSMYDTLSDGDLLFANKLESPTRGDIVVIYDTDIDDEALIKRVICLQGDDIWTINGFVYITYTDEGGNRVTERLKEDYLLKIGVTKINDKITIPDGYVFVMGDNREKSSDSRYFGCVKTSSILGVVPDWSVEIKDSVFINWYKKIIT